MALNDDLKIQLSDKEHSMELAQADIQSSAKVIQESDAVKALAVKQAAARALAGEISALKKQIYG